MPRIVIAGASESGREQLTRLLASSGFSVFRCCASGSDLRRTVSACEDGVVIMLGNLPDCRADELYWDLGDRVQVLLIARPAVLEDCEAPEVFRLALPAASQTVIGAVDMLAQFHQMRLPKRAKNEKQIVEQAKALLMAQTGLSEPEAHRAMQQYAMNHGVKMADYASEIIQKSGTTSRRTEK